MRRVLLDLARDPNQEQRKTEIAELGALCCVILLGFGMTEERREGRH